MSETHFVPIIGFMSFTIIIINEITYLIGYTIIIKLIVRERRIRGKHNPMTIRI